MWYGLPDLCRPFISCLWSRQGQVSGCRSYRKTRAVQFSEDLHIATRVPAPRETDRAGNRNLILEGHLCNRRCTGACDSSSGELVHHAGLPATGSFPEGPLCGAGKLLTFKKKHIRMRAAPAGCSESPGGRGTTGKCC